MCSQETHLKAVNVSDRSMEMERMGIKVPQIRTSSQTPVGSSDKTPWWGDTKHTIPAAAGCFCEDSKGILLRIYPRIVFSLQESYREMSTCEKSQSTGVNLTALQL